MPQLREGVRPAAELGAMSEKEDIKPPRPEIAKVPRDTCGVCGLVWPAPIVVDGRCANLILCQVRVNRNARRKKREGGK